MNGWNGIWIGFDSGGAVPVVIVRRAELARFEQERILPKQAIVVSDGDHGWIASDRATGEVSPLSASAWCELRGVRIKLAGGDDELAGSLVDVTRLLSPELEVRDGARPGDKATSVRLPSREGEAIAIGRNPAEAQVVLADARVSRRHVVVRVAGGRHELENLSQYPPLLNGKALRARAALANGDEIRIGESLLVYRNPLEALPGPEDKAEPAPEPSPPAAPLPRPRPGSAPRRPLPWPCAAWRRAGEIAFLAGACVGLALVVAVAVLMVVRGLGGAP